MNTDNMTISGETIDYGPCAFMEAFDPATVFSSIDHGGRYAYGNQPAAAEWNLACFAETLLPLIDTDTDRAIELALAAPGDVPDRVQRRVVRRDTGETRSAEQVSPGAVEPVGVAAAEPGGLDVVLPGPGHAARGDAGPARGLFVDLAGFDAWLERWRVPGLTATRWIGSIPCTSRATNWSRKR